MYSPPLFRYAKIGRRQAQEVAEKVSLALVVSLQEAFDASTSTGIAWLPDKPITCTFIPDHTPGRLLVAAREFRGQK